MALYRKNRCVRATETNAPLAPATVNDPKLNEENNQMESILKAFDLINEQSGAGTGIPLRCNGPLLNVVSPINGRQVGSVRSASRKDYETVVSQSVDAFNNLAPNTGSPPRRYRPSDWRYPAGQKRRIGGFGQPGNRKN